MSKDYRGKDFSTGGFLSGLPLSDYLVWTYKSPHNADTPFKLPDIEQHKYEASFLGCSLGEFIITWDGAKPIAVKQV